MATLPHPPMTAEVSVEEYLATSFDGPDAEFVEGVVVERAMPSRPHAQAQKVLIKTFGAIEDSREIDVYAELRVRLSRSRVRVPDVSIFRRPMKDDVPATPPLLAAEIVSPSDIHTELMRRLAEYAEWGVENIWLIDPGSRRLAVYRGNRLEFVEALELAEFGVRVGADELFGE